MTTDNPLPSAQPLMVAGASVALAGYLLPWFKASPGKRWWYSGSHYFSLGEGGGWTALAVVALVVAIGASFWAARHPVAHALAVVGGGAGAFLAAAVVAVSFGTLPSRDSNNWIVELPFGVGLPLLALGLGLFAAGALHARPAVERPTPRE